MANILVRVLPNRRIRELGATWIGGQVLSIPEERFESISDTVELVNGVPVPEVKPKAAPSIPVLDTGMPLPQLDKPRTLKVSSTDDDDDSAEFTRVVPKTSVKKAPDKKAPVTKRGSK